LPLLIPFGVSTLPPARALAGSYKPPVLLVGLEESKLSTVRPWLFREIPWLTLMAPGKAGLRLVVTWMVLVTPLDIVGAVTIPVAIIVGPGLVGIRTTL